MHHEIAIGSTEHRVQPGDQLGVADPLARSTSSAPASNADAKASSASDVSITAGTTPV